MKKCTYYYAQKIKINKTCDDIYDGPRLALFLNFSDVKINFEQYFGW